MSSRSAPKTALTSAAPKLSSYFSKAAVVRRPLFYSTGPTLHGIILIMKTLFNLLLAIVLLVVFGGTAFFMWDVSKGARFERTDVSAPAE